MISMLSTSAGAVLNFVSNLIPQPVANTASAVTEVAMGAVSYLTSPSGAASRTIPAHRVRSIGFYKEFKARTETAYEKASLLRHLRAKPKVSKAVLIEDYLSALAPTKVTHKIYDKLKSKWGYRHFYRTLDTGSRGLACAFLMHVILEDSHKTPSPIHDRVLSFLQATLDAKTYPDIQETLRTMIESFQFGYPQISAITTGEACPFLDTLSDVLVRNFFEKNRFTEDLTFPAFIEAIPDVASKGSLNETISALGEYPSAPLVPLLGPKQSFFGHNPLVKFSFILEHLPSVLEKVKTLLKAHIDAPAVVEWMSALEPIKLLTAFEDDPIGMAKKDTLKPRMIELFKEELIKLLTPNASLFLEGFSFSKRATHATHFQTIADELVSLDGAYLTRLTQIPTVKLFSLARALEDFEEELTQRQLRFVNHLADSFNISFVVHSWQISQTDKKRLKISHIGKWYGPTCHIVLFPENNTSRVDLLRQHGAYAARSELVDLIHSASFKKYKRHGSETLAMIADPASATSAADKLLARHFIYYRLHIFACLQKLLYSKLTLLKDPLRFDSCGNLEDDGALNNPFGSDHAELLPDFHSEVEANMYRIEKHLSNLNREIAELAYLTDSVFSHTKHEEIISEIQILLKAAKKATFQFYLSKIPDFIAGFKAIIASLEADATREFGALKPQNENYLLANPTKMAEFVRIFGKASYRDVTAHELIGLIPKLNIEHNPPDVFADFTKLKKLIDVYQEASGIDAAVLEREIGELFETVKKEKARFLAFYPDRAAPFAAIFEAPVAKDTPSARLAELIPQDRLQHAEMQKIIASMTLLMQKLVRLEFRNKTLSPAGRLALETLRAQIVSKRAQFVEVNPTMGGAFDTLFREPNPWSINRLDLHALKAVPKGAHEDDKVMQDIKSFLKTVQKLHGFRKELAKIEEKFAAYQAKTVGSFAEIEIYDSDDEAFPEAGSLGAPEGDTASLGGASYSSELRSVGSLEKWIGSLL